MLKLCYAPRGSEWCDCWWNVAYQKALIFVKMVYGVCKSLPRDEKYSLIDQFRRAAISVALNIAEGTGASNAEFNRFLNISRRSIKECVAIIAIAKMNGYINGEIESILRSKCIELSKMISGITKNLKYSSRS